MRQLLKWQQMLKAKSLDEPKIGKLATRNIHELLKLTTWSHTSVLHIETLVLFSHWKCSKNTGQRVWGKSRLYIQDILYCPSHKKWMTASNLHSSFVELPSAQCSGKNHFPSPPKKSVSLFIIKNCGSYDYDTLILCI